MPACAQARASALAGVGSTFRMSPLRGTPLSCKVKPLMSLGGAGMGCPADHVAVPLLSSVLLLSNSSQA